MNSENEGPKYVGEVPDWINNRELIKELTEDQLESETRMLEGEILKIEARKQQLEEEKQRRKQK